VSDDKTTEEADGSDELEALIASLDPVIEVLNRIPDDADFRGRTWAAIQKLREACAWLTVDRVTR
jgi:hypothetical protein